MKAFFLDDDTERVKQFDSNLHEIDPTMEVITAQTASDANEILRKSEFDYIFLDHDLGGKVYVDEAGSDTGSEVIRTMVAEDLQPNAKVFVHSMNARASRNMISTLGRGYYRPYAWLYDDLKKIMDGTDEEPES